MGDMPPPLSRSFFLWGGIPALIVFSVLVAVGWDPGLADFLFWLTVIWIVLARYVESGGSSGEFPQQSRPALRAWRRFSVILIAIGAVLYALAKMAAARYGS
jgi:hypothetical protein